MGTKEVLVNLENYDLWGQYEGKIGDLLETSREETGIVVSWDD